MKLTCLEQNVGPAQKCGALLKGQQVQCSFLPLQRNALVPVYHYHLHCSKFSRCIPFLPMSRCFTQCFAPILYQEQIKPIGPHCHPAKDEFCKGALCRKKWYKTHIIRYEKSLESTLYHITAMIHKQMPDPQYFKTVMLLSNFVTHPFLNQFLHKQLSVISQ